VAEVSAVVGGVAGRGRGIGGGEVGPTPEGGGEVGPTPEGGGEVGPTPEAGTGAGPGEETPRRRADPSPGDETPEAEADHKNQSDPYCVGGGVHPIDFKFSTVFLGRYFPWGFLVIIVTLLKKRYSVYTLCFIKPCRNPVHKCSRSQ